MENIEILKMFHISYYLYYLRFNKNYTIQKTLPSNLFYFEQISCVKIRSALIMWLFVFNRQQTQNKKRVSCAACETVSSASAIKPCAAFYIPPFRDIVYFTSRLFLMKCLYSLLLLSLFRRQNWSRCEAKLTMFKGNVTWLRALFVSVMLDRWIDLFLIYKNILIFITSVSEEIIYIEK